MFDKKDQSQQNLSENILLFVAVFVIYWFTFAPIATSDGNTAALRVQGLVPVDVIFNSVSKPLYFAVGYVIYHFLQAVGLELDGITFVQLFSGSLGALAIVIFFRLVQKITGHKLSSLVLALILTFSKGVWFYANGELYTASLVFLLTSFFILIRDKTVLNNFIWLGILGAAAILTHLDNIMFVPVVLLAIWKYGNLGPRRMNASLIYLGLTAGITAIFQILLGWFVLGFRTIGEYWNWATWQTETKHFVQTRSSNNILPFLLRNTAKTAKGQFASLSTGGNLLTDFAQYHDYYILNLNFVFLSLLTLITVLILGWILIVGLKRWRCLTSKFAYVILLSITWIFSFKLFHFWWAPSLDEYSTVVLPPFLFIIGIILAGNNNSVSKKEWILLISLLIVVGFTNFWGAIWPWRQYSIQSLDMVKAIESTYPDGGLLVTTSSSLAFQPSSRYEILIARKILATNSFQDTVATVEEQMQQAIADGRTVLLYNWVPSGAQLYDPSNPNYLGVTATELEAVLDRWEDEFTLTPILVYWEWVPQYDTFGNRNVKLYQVNLPGDQ